MPATKIMFCSLATRWLYRVYWRSDGWFYIEYFTTEKWVIIDIVTGPQSIPEFIANQLAEGI
jgi:hypothetical protein